MEFKHCQGFRSQDLMTQLILTWAALSSWLLFCALSVFQGTFKTGSKVCPTVAALYRQHNNQAKEYSLAVFAFPDRAALIDRRPFDPPPRDKLFKPTVEKPKETGLAQNQFRRGPKVAN